MDHRKSHWKPTDMFPEGDGENTVYKMATDLEEGFKIYQREHKENPRYCSEMRNKGLSNQVDINVLWSQEKNILFI